MKKTTTKKSPTGSPLGNPLKFFNDNKAKRSAEPKQNLRKAQNGISVPYMGGTKENPSNTPPTFDQVGIKNTYQGPLNEKDQLALDRSFPSTAFAPTASGKGAPASYSKSGRIHATRSPREQGYMTAEAGEEYSRKRAENYLRSDHQNMKSYNKYPEAEPEDVIFDKRGQTEAEDRKMTYEGDAYKRGGRVRKTVMQKGGPVKKMQKGGILTPNGRIKSNKTRNIEVSSYGSKADVSRTKRDGSTVTKSVTTSRGFVPTAQKTKTVTDKSGNVVSNKTKSIGYNKADRKTNRVINNVGRNANDTWAYKKGGVAKTKKKK